MTIRSSSLVNEATGVKFLKDGMESGEPKKRSSQADKIAAAAAAVGPRGGRGRKNENKPAKAPGKDIDRRQPGASGPKREGAKVGAPRGGNPPRDGKPGRRGEPRRDGKPRDPAMKDRLDYYKSKYGEEFKPSHVEEKAKKPGLLGKIAGLFGLGKKKEK